MKSYYLTLTFFFIVLISGGCLKYKGVNPAATIKGKWNLIRDTTSLGLGPNVTNKNYQGIAGDYFDIRDDGKIYVKEGATLDTLNYTILNGYSIEIQKFGWVINGTQTTSTINYTSPSTINITSASRDVPSGTNWRSVSLGR